MISYSVVGASGYVGGELLRLAASHPELSLRQAAAHTNAEEAITSIHSHLTHLAGSTFDPINIGQLLEVDVVFLALPHGKSADLASQLSDTQLVIDAGADFRLSSSSDWVSFYDTPHAGTWPYGLPELTLATKEKQRVAIRGAKRIAAPGCNVSAITLALAPGYSAGIFSEKSNSVLAVGTSGAGRSLQSNLLASEVMGSATAYGVAGQHRHNPEIRQNLVLAGAEHPVVTFTPILVPMSRGILAVTHVEIADEVTESQLRKIYEDAYGGEPFVNILPLGQQPSTGSVLGSNYAQIAIQVDANSRVATITTAIDNLVKGTAGAAIQCMNIALGLPETSGLSQLGVAP